jgi:hypothetical protein
MAAVEVYDHDDPGFSSWLGEHPDGYVLNCYKTGKVHTALCSSYRSAGPLMTHTRPRACSTSEEQLLKHAAQEGYIVERCQLCL